ncbi:chondroitinase-B domain-containing protein [Algibacillus agarilyticus]|uniref:chondroitinase-B domain-containing protein n=1 Tax=Algibacillus agarilyticus TaxID=2234133 RepID=UPI000DD097B2|nr:chondroitinase-B domain-containing protein [Algibacillus agarilyticus]
MNRNLITLALLSALAACDKSDDPAAPTSAVISGDLTATLTEDSATSFSGNILVTDPDEGEAVFIAQTNTPGDYGVFNLNAEGEWSYVVDTTNTALQALTANETVTETFTISAKDGTSKNISVSITGENDQAVFSSGELVDSGMLSKGVNQSISGMLVVTDADANQALVNAIPTLDTTYGSFSMTEAGAWQYTIDETNAEFIGLDSEDKILTETIDVTSVDGTEHLVYIIIAGKTPDVTHPVGSLAKGSIGDNDSVPAINCTETVTSTSQLEDAASYSMAAGTTLCLAAGEYSGLDLSFGGTGTADQPVTIAAAEPGKVTISGEVSVAMSGEFVTLQGFIFKDGTMNNTLIQTRGNSNTPCNNCRITEISVINMDQGIDSSTKWVYIYGTNNRIDHNWFAGKTTRGALLAVDRYVADGVVVDDTFEVDRAQIDHNYFGDRPPVNGNAYPASNDNEYEGIRLGTSDSHTGDSYSVVEHNYFERIQGEAEVISNKSGHNTIRHNTIRDSYGSIVTRHGEYATIDNNFIFGDDYPFSGGIRLVDGNHTVTNNYVEGARYVSTNWNGGIVLSSSNGSTSNGYQDVENVLIANNTIVDSVNSFNVFGGKESTQPDSIYFVNNIIANAIGPVIKSANKLPTNSVYAGNLVFGQAFSDDSSVTSLPGMTFADAKLVKGDSGLFRPSAESPDLSADLTANTGSFSLPTVDMDGDTRSATTTIGADETTTAQPVRGPLTAALVGPINYTPPSITPHIAKLGITNYDFDSGDLTGWTNNGGSVTTNADEVFSRGASLMLDSNSADVNQTITLDANTNYTLSAFMKGIAKLSVMVDGTPYSVDVSSNDYKFASVSFNSGAATTAVIKATVDDFVNNEASIKNANFDDKQTDWVVVEGTGIGQVQDSSNSSTSTDNSIKFKYDSSKGDDGTPHDPYIAQTVMVNPNTDYTLAMYQLLKSSHTNSTINFGAFAEAVDGSDTDVLLNAATIINSKVSTYADLSDTPTGEDSFKQDTVTFNSGDNTAVTIFAEFNSTTGDEIRVDEFDLFYAGSPAEGTKAYFDSIRLVAHAKLN